MGVRRFFSEWWFPEVHREAKLFPKIRDERDFYRGEKEKLEKRVTELETFIANVETRLKQEATEVKKNS